jgi:hypothetical protein
MVGKFKRVGRQDLVQRTPLVRFLPCASNLGAAVAGSSFAALVIHLSMSISFLFTLVASERLEFNVKQCLVQKERECS